MNKDKDGFIKLTKKVPVRSLMPASVPLDDDDNKKKKVPKFKKSSWKYWLFDRLKHHRVPHQVEDFHFTKVENLLVVFGTKDRILESSHKRFDLFRLKKIGNTYEDAHVLINIGDMMYMKIPIKSYLKLMKIDRMIIDFSLQSSWDGLDYEEIYHREYILDNINDLGKFINFHRQGVEGVYDLQGEYLALNELKYRMKILVQKTDGTVDTYKSDMNDFMKEYGLYLF